MFYYILVFLYIHNVGSNHLNPIMKILEQPLMLAKSPKWCVHSWRQQVSFFYEIDWLTWQVVALSENSYHFVILLSFDKSHTTMQMIIDTAWLRTESSELVNFIEKLGQQSLVRKIVWFSIFMFQGMFTMIHLQKLQLWYLSMVGVW